MSSIIRAGILGTGLMDQTHTRHLMIIEDVSVVAGCDSQIENARALTRQLEDAEAFDNKINDV